MGKLRDKFWMLRNQPKTLLKRESAGLRYARQKYEEIQNDIPFLNWYHQERPRLKKFKDKHQGEDCFIIGNGPSLNKMDLEPLNDYHTFGLNKIFLIFEKVRLDLSYHVAVNPLVVTQNAEQFKQLNCPTFLPYQYSRKTDLSGENIYKFNTAGYCLFGTDLQKELWNGCTVTYVAMQIAYYMGFKRVFLIGVDHNFQQKGKAGETQSMKGKDPNHFHPEYFKGQKWQLADLEGSELSYQMAKFVFERAGGAIYDATINGKLAIYPKISYEEALKECAKKKS